jgi:hypothetical protein
VANFEALRAGVLGGLAVVGSVTRADEPIRHLRRMGFAATPHHGLAVFRGLAARPASP